MAKTRKRKAGIVRWVVLDPDEPRKYVNVYRDKPEPHEDGSWTGDCGYPSVLCRQDVQRSLTRGRLPRKGERKRFRFTATPE
jgi:hypothetical protein